MVHSVSGRTRGVCAGKTVKSLENACIPERLRGVFTTRRYTNLRLPYITSTVDTRRRARWYVPYYRIWFGSICLITLWDSVTSWKRSLN